MTSGIMNSCRVEKVDEQEFYIFSVHYLETLVPSLDTKASKNILRLLHGYWIINGKLWFLVPVPSFSSSLLFSPSPLLSSPLLTVWPSASLGGSRPAPQDRAWIQLVQVLYLLMCPVDSYLLHNCSQLRCWERIESGRVEHLKS